MSRKFLTPIDMTNLEILNLRLQQTQPAGTVVGLTYYDATTTNRPQVYSGAAWNTVPFVGAGTPGNITPGTLQSAAAGSSNFAARLDHTHGSPGLAVGPATDGFMAGSDKAKLDAATSVATATTLVYRDASSRFRAADPADVADVATKGYVDNVAAGMSWKPAVKRATTAVISLASGTRSALVLTTGTTTLSVDGAAVANTDRILIKDGTSGLAGAGSADNGIFVVSGVGTNVTLTRASDMDTWPEAPAAAVFVELGSSLADTAWVCTADSGGTLGTTAITFVQFAGASTYTFGSTGAGTTLVATNSTANAFKVRTVGVASAKLTIAVASDSVNFDVSEANLTLNNIGGTLGATKGGTGLTTYAQGDILYASAANTLSALAAAAAGNVLLSGTTPSWGKVALASAVSGTLPVGNGGTGVTALTTNGVLYGGATVGVTAAGTQYQVLQANGSGVPVFGAVNLAQTAAVTGTLPIANGGTNSATALTGSSIMISNGTSIIQGAAGTTSQVLHGNAAGAPTYGAVVLTSEVSGTLPVANGGTGAATLTQYAVLLGNATSAVAFAAPGTAGIALVSTGATSNPAFGAVSLTAGVSGTLPVANGGTNSSTALTGSSIMVSNGTAIVQGAAGTSTTVLHGNASGTPTYGAVSLTADVSGTLPVGNGGTGAATLTQYAVLLGNATSAVAFAAPGTAGIALVSTGATSNPAFGAVSLTAGVSGVLPAANGGTSFSTYATGDTIYASAANTLSKLTIGTTGQVLTVSAGGVPVWQAAAAGVVRATAVFGAITGGTPVVVTTGVTAATPIVQVYDNATKALVECDIVVNSSTQVTFTFAANASASAYYWTLLA
jgi:hypothetical protein